MNKSNKLLRIYDGFSGDGNLRIYVFRKNVELSRSYIGLRKKISSLPQRIRVTWRFDEEGKTKIMDRYSYQNRMEEIFFEEVDTEKMNIIIEPNKRLVYFNRIPKDISCVKGLGDDLINKYLRLLRMGYSISLDLLDNMSRNMLKPPEETKNLRKADERRLSLMNIVNDEFALESIKRISKLRPSLKIGHRYRDGGLFLVLYESLGVTVKP